jgi:hypothetical protein
MEMTGKFYSASEWAAKQAKEAPKPKLPRGRPPGSTKPKRVRLTLDLIWEKFEEAIGNSFPDGDPRDFMFDHMREWGYDHQDLLRAVKKHNKGVTSVNHLLGQYWDQFARDKLYDARESNRSPDHFDLQFIQEKNGVFYLKDNPWFTPDQQKQERKEYEDECCQAT